MGYVSATLSQQRAERMGLRFDRIGAGLERGLDTLPRSGHEVAAERIARREGDGVDEAVEAAPALLERLRQGVDLFLLVDVHLQDLRSGFHPAGALLRQAHHSAKAGQHDVGALFLGRVGYREGDAGWSEDASDQDLLPLEDARHDGPILSEVAPVLRGRSEGWLEGFEPSTLRSTI